MPDHSKLLYNESPLQVSPTLARYIGLNEALFLQQLHYILTQNNKVGKEADGRKWYRDKPIAFIEKYFPFWDESTLKRTMDNLRDDNLLLTRSDLNTRPKDRSLWYSINYQALNDLDSPVARIIEKSQKRSKARQARPQKSKVQNELLTVTKVQNEPRSKVQNELTPKDSMPKDSFTTTRSAADILTNIYLLTANGKPTQTGADIINAILDSYPADIIIYACQQAELNTTPSDDKRNLSYIEAVCKRKASGQPDKVYKNGANQNGHNQKPYRQNSTAGATGESIANEPSVDPFTNEWVYPDGRREPIT